MLPDGIPLCLKILNWSLSMQAWANAYSFQHILVSQMHWLLLLDRHSKSLTVSDGLQKPLSHRIVHNSLSHRSSLTSLRKMWSSRKHTPLHTGSDWCFFLSWLFLLSSHFHSWCCIPDGCSILIRILSILLWLFLPRLSVRSGCFLSHTW